MNESGEFNLMANGAYGEIDTQKQDNLARFNFCKLYKYNNSLYFIQIIYILYFIVLKQVLPKIERDFTIVINKVNDFCTEIKNIKTYTAELAYATSMQLFLTNPNSDEKI